jgi:glycosyltransferase involved in cell wall biosynthesis
MVVYDMQSFGGLEEYAVALARGLVDEGHHVSILSAGWIPPDNQYLRRLREDGIRVARWPGVISKPASDWPTKEKLARALVHLATPLLAVLAIVDSVARRRSLRRSFEGSLHWFRNQVMQRAIGREWRPILGRVLLSAWRLGWRFDMLHVHGYTTNLLFAVEWAHARRVPVVYEEHQTPHAQFDWWGGFERSVNKADVVIAVSGESAEALRKVCKVIRPVVVGGRLVPDPFQGDRQGWMSVKPPGDGLVVSTVARLYVTKGLTHLLDAIVLVRRAHPATRFRVYGDGELRGELLEKAARLGLDGDQIFVGSFTSRADLGRILSGTDIFVLSSILEGQPLVVIEAMAYGRPIVTTAVGGIPELIKDGINGLLCQPADPEALARGILRVIEDPALRIVLGREARRTYEELGFQPAAVTRRMLGIYRQALCGGNVPNTAPQGTPL